MLPQETNCCPGHCISYIFAQTNNICQCYCPLYLNYKIKYLIINSGKNYGGFHEEIFKRNISTLPLENLKVPEKIDPELKTNIPKTPEKNNEIFK